LRGWVDRGHQGNDGSNDGHFLPAHDAGDDRPIGPDQETIHRILRFRHDLALDEQHHQDRHQRHRKQRRAGHREGLGEGQRREQPPFLAFQREHREEGNSDDEQREEQRRADFLAGGEHGVGALGLGVLLGQALQVLVGVLDHHDGGVDHGADGDGDASQAHQIGVHAQRAHGDEGDQHADRQHQDGDQGAAHVHQEDHADQRDDDCLFNQRPFQRVDGAVYQFGTVVHRLHRDSLRQAGTDFGDPDFRLWMTSSAFCAVAGHGNARHDFAFTVEFGQATPLVGRQFDPCDVADQHWRALVAFDHQRFEVALAAQVALAAHHVLGFGHLDDAATDIAVRVADHLRDLHQRNAVGTQFHRVDSDLIGLHEAADRSDFGDAMGLGQLIAQYQSWIVRSSARVLSLASSAYWYTQPTPVASGPSDGVTPFGMRLEAKFRYSRTRERAQ
jgi:hypothetical protein